MKEALVRLYTRIIHVLLRAIQWYRQGKLKHSISAIFQPWALTFHEHLEAIKEDSIRLDNLSDMATKAELRDTRTEIIEARRDWAETKSELQTMRLENKTLADMIKLGFSRLDTTVTCKLL